MADEGTLATTAQVLFLLGENAGTNQILEANTNFAILFAESTIFLETDTDFVNATIYAALETNVKQSLALCAGSLAAIILINQNPNAWQLATTQDKKNVLNTLYTDNLKRIKAVDL